MVICDYILLERILKSVVRDVDIENANRLKRMQEITVLESISEIEGVVRRHVEGIDGRSYAISLRLNTTPNK